MGNSPPRHLQFHVIHNKQHAQHFLDNVGDSYLEECHDDIRNSSARNHMTYSANTVSSNDINQLRALNTIALPKRLLADLGTVHMIQLMPTADGGMPHTRIGSAAIPIICYADPHIITKPITLIHELWHVHQRIYKKEWTTIFHTLEWTEWGGELPTSLENCRRYNPDTIDSPLWIYQKRWVPIPIFADISHPTINDVTMWFYDVIDQYHIKQIPTPMLSFWPDLPLSAYEHPRELTAYLLSDPNASSPALHVLLKMLGNIAIIT